MKGHWPRDWNLNLSSLTLWVKSPEACPLSFPVEFQPQTFPMQGECWASSEATVGSWLIRSGFGSRGVSAFAEPAFRHAWLFKETKDFMSQKIIAALASIILNLENKHISIFLSIRLPDHFAWGQFTLPEPGSFCKDDNKNSVVSEDTFFLCPFWWDDNHL